MNLEPVVELFLLKCAVLRTKLDASKALAERESPFAPESPISPLLAQVSMDIRVNAEKMSEYYKVFYLLENDIRQLINQTLTEVHGAGWWDTASPKTAKDEYVKNRTRELESGLTSRSDSQLDYVTFGQLGDIIRANYTHFGGILSNEAAMGRVMYSLNLLRGPIAHCGVLAEDEVDRLKLAVKDWFRLLEGPK